MNRERANAPPLLEPGQAPPPDYYAAKIRLMVEHVARSYGDLLDRDQTDRLRSFLELSTDGQRLFARLVSRRGPWIRCDKLSYREIADLEQAIATLEEAAFIEINPAAPADALLTLLTQTERRSLFPHVSGRRRAEWIEDCLARYPDRRIRQVLSRSLRWLRLSEAQPFGLWRLLFFGDHRADISTFVLEDLGVLRYEPYPLSGSVRLFADRAALDRDRQLARLAALSHRLAEVPGLDQWLLGALRTPVSGRRERLKRDRVLNRLGHHFERSGRPQSALAAYVLSNAHPSRERRVRILKRLGETAAASRLAVEMGRAPRCAEELDFSRRFRAAGRPTSAFQPRTCQWQLHESPEGRIEAHAAALLLNEARAVFHLENVLPLALAGLAFWDVLFAPVPGAFANPYQSMPLDLFWRDFADTRKAAIDARVAELSSEPGAARQALEATYRAKWGTANRLVAWRALDETTFGALLAGLPEPTLVRLATHVIRQPYRTRNGFPDLTVLYADGRHEFVEVKGPTDQLQPAQRIWLQALEALGEPARVLKFSLA